MPATAPTTAPSPSTPLPCIQGPIWLQTLQAIVTPISFLEKAYSKYGDIFEERFSGFPPFIVLNHPNAIEQVFTADPSLFDSTVGNGLISPITGDQGLFYLDGKAHQQRRKLLMPPFHGERMRAYGQSMCAIATEVAQKWPQNEPFTMRATTQEISLRVILHTIFGIDYNERFQKLCQLLGEMLHTFDTSLGSSHLYLHKFAKRSGSLELVGKVFTPSSAN